jgi:hypothetical protein
MDTKKNGRYCRFVQQKKGEECSSPISLFHFLRVSWVQKFTQGKKKYTFYEIYLL